MFIGGLMAVYRRVNITYWQDKFILTLTPEEKFFYIYLLTNSKTKQCGIHELPIQIIQVETGYNRETVMKLIQRFIEHEKIKYDWEHEEIFLLNWIKHNAFEKNPLVKKCVIKELEEVHNIEMIPEDSPLKHLISPLQAPSQKEKEKEQKEEQEKVNPVISEKDFEELWKLYPNKDGKSAAYRHFKASVKTALDLDDVRRAISNYLKSEKVRNGFVKNGSTFFNNWKDWVNPSPSMMGRVAIDNSDPNKKGQYNKL